jgi:hypothetical protein
VAAPQPEPQAAERGPEPERSKVESSTATDPAALLDVQTPPETPSTHSAESQSKARYEVTAELAELFTPAVADQVVKALNEQLPLYEASLTSPNAEHSSFVASRILFFAIWPDLPKLIASKQVKLEVQPRNSASLRRSSMSSSSSRPDRTIHTSLQTQDWIVGFAFDANSFPEPPYKELWDRVFLLMDAEHDKR